MDSPIQTPTPITTNQEELQTLKMAIQQMNEAVEAIETKLDAYGLESRDTRFQSMLDIIKKYTEGPRTEIIRSERIR